MNSKKATNPKKKVTGTIAKDIIPPKDEMEKMKDRTVKKISSKVKKDTKHLVKQVAEEAAASARQRMDKELAPKTLSNPTPVSKQPESLQIEPISRPVKPELEDITDYITDPVVFNSMEDLEKYSLQIWGMGLVSGIALYHLASKVMSWFGGNQSSSSNIVESIIDDAS